MYASIIQHIHILSASEFNNDNVKLLQEKRLFITFLLDVYIENFFNSNTICISSGSNLYKSFIIPFVSFAPTEK